MSGQWANTIHKLMSYDGPFAPPDKDTKDDIKKWLEEECRLLVIGAGGLGCELLKDLTLVGFRNIEVIDMDTIDYSNLNRQFLFRPKDVNSPKATVAAEFINKRVKGAKVIGHHKSIQEFSKDYYRQFHLVVAGLDSINARKWLNDTLVSLAVWDEPNQRWDPKTIIPLIDGGTEGWAGQTRVILPHITPCFTCLLHFFPDDPLNFPMCTIAHTPRQPEHCIAYAIQVLWPEVHPEEKIDNDNPDHIQWLNEKALARAAEFKIEGVNYKLTQGVSKRIIPAIACTNAIISASCANEAFKIATATYTRLNNYMAFSGIEGCSTNTFEAELTPGCLSCGRSPSTVEIDPNQTLKEFIDNVLVGSTTGRFAEIVAPTLMLASQTGTKIQIAGQGFFAKKTAPNLPKKMSELMEEGDSIAVTDKGKDKTWIITVKWQAK